MSESIQHTCPSCFTQLDSLLPVTDRRPVRSDDFIICGACGQVSQLGEHMEILKLDDDAFGELLVSNPAAYDAIRVIQESMKKHINQN